MLRVALVVIVCLSLWVGPSVAAGEQSTTIVAVYPNPVTPGDAGEFVVLSVPAAANTSRLTLTDGETTVGLPPDAGNGSIALSTAANETRKLIDRPVRQLPGRLNLANTGDRVELRRGNRTVDAIAYEDAPEGDIRRRGEDGREWRPLGATDRPIVTADDGTVEAFVLPDAAGAPTDHLATAEDRILLAGYTLTSRRVAATLRNAHRRNVTVRVLVEGSPVGGVAERQADRLDHLVDAGIEVRVVGGDRARYRFHHAKYAVVDDRTLVTTENWKPAGVGGRASRGWGVVTNQSRIVSGLVQTFRADAGWRDAIPWERYRDGINATASEPATGTYPSRIEPAHVPVERTRLLVAPDNAERSVTAAIERAEDSLWVEQASVGGVEQPFVRSSVDAARRGVSVRLLLGNAWYNREENEAVVDRLEAIAEREELDLEARLVDPRGRFEAIHAKGAVIDGERVLLGSLNWNNNSARHNREVALVMRGQEIGEYYESVIRSDWRGGDWRVAAGLLAAVLLAVLVAVAAARTIGFESVRRR